MMQMLTSAGIEALTDGIREADGNNPRGYYEFERAKGLPTGDTAWLKDARGKVVKIVSPLLMHLPEGFTYRIVFMQRDLDEVLRSQAKMRDRLGTADADMDTARLRAEYEAHLTQTLTWARRQPFIKLLTVDHRGLLTDPAPQIQAVADFLSLDASATQAMSTVIDPDLYRERKNDD